MMQVSIKSAKGEGHTTYTIEAVIEGQSFAANHTLSDGAYATISTKDRDQLIESQLWQHLMHNIEHHLRRIAYANA